MNSIDITPTKGYPHMYDFIGNKATVANPLVLIVLTCVIVIYYFIFSYLGVSAKNNIATTNVSSPGITFIEIIMWGMFIFLVLINGLQYFLKIDIKTGIKNLFTPIPEIDVTVTTEGDQNTKIFLKLHTKTKYFIFQIMFILMMMQKLCAKHMAHV